MRNMKKHICLLAILVCFMNSSALVLASANETYTYTYNYWEEIQESPDAYRVVKTYNYQAMGLDKKLLSPQGLFIKDDMIYICDTGNNRVVQLQRTGNDVSLVRIIDTIPGAVELNTFAGPSDIYVDDNGYLYIADTNNGRIVKLASDLSLITLFTKPSDNTFDQNISYLPYKVVADSVGRVFVIATNVNKGIVKYEVDGTFTGFVGATEAKYSVSDYLVKRFSTQAQRAQMSSFVPTEYDNIFMDHDGFIYAVTTNFSEYDLKSDKAKPIRRLNSMGTDILIKNGNYPPIGDLYWGEGGGISGPSKITDITAFDSDCYVGLDKMRGRLFGYDSQGNFLFAFGGYGNLEGFFRSPVAIDHMGLDLFVLDSLDCEITLFETTEYGNNIYKAIDAYKLGEYELSADYWREVLRMNGNYDMAYIGIGRSLIRQGDYKQAMEYFELTWDADNYDKAFKLYRKDWIEDHIGIIFTGFFVIIGLPLMIGKVKKMKWEVDQS